MDAVVIIPARYGSTRFPGKPLAMIAGKSMIQRVYERARAARLVDEVIVATDDERILDAVRGFGGRARLTSPEHRNGSERIAEVAAGLAARVVINVQGDEPLIEPAMIDQAAAPLLAEGELVVATLKTPLRDAGELRDPNIVKVVCGKDGFALYFSRSPLPYERDLWREEVRPSGNHFKHVGLYAYRRDFLLHFCSLPGSSLEEAERLEQLRILENGYRIKVIETAYKSVGVDAPEDIKKIEDILLAEGAA